MTKAREGLTAAREQLDQHVAGLGAAEERLTDLRGRAAEASDADFAEATAAIERRTLATQQAHDTIATAEAAVRAALGAQLTDHLAGASLSPEAVTVENDTQARFLTDAVRAIRGNVQAFNAQVRTAIASCREVDLVEGRCDPMAAVYVTAAGALMVNDVEAVTLDVDAVVARRIAEAVEAAK